MKFNKIQAKKLNRFKNYLDSFYDGTRKIRLPLQTMKTMVDCYNELNRTGKTITFQSEVADIFKTKGFKVKRDEHNVNYIITV